MILLVPLLYALFSTGFVVGKTALFYTTPMFLIGVRMFFSAIILLGFQALFMRENFKLSRIAFKRIFLLALTQIYITHVFEFWGLQYLTAVKTCLIFSLSPFISCVMSYFMFNEKMTLRKLMGLGIGFVGLVPILLQKDAGEVGMGHISFLSWAEIAVIIATISSVYGWSLVRQLVKEDKCHPLMANGMSMLLGAGFSFVHSYFTDTWNPLPVAAGGASSFILCCTYLVFVSSIICYNLYGYLVKYYTVTLLSFAGLTTPLFAALFGWIFLGETVGIAFFLSAAILSSGLFIFYQEELRQGYVNKPLKA
jgi:drug/metabolite transporter (DMT)-like permease